MLKVSALFLCVISCLVFHCNDSQGDSATERQTSSSNYSSDNAQMAEKTIETQTAGEQSSTDHKADVDKLTALMVEMLQDAAATDDTVRDDSKEERPLGSDDVTYDPYSTHRSRFPSESQQKAVSHDEADAASLPPSGTIGMPTTNQERVEEEKKIAQIEEDDRSQEATKDEDIDSTPPTANKLVTSATPPTTTTPHMTDSQIDRPPTTTDQPPVDTPDQPPVAEHDEPPKDTSDQSQPLQDTPVDSTKQPPVDTDDRPPQDTRVDPPQDKPPVDSEQPNMDESESHKEEVGTEAAGRQEEEGKDSPGKVQKGPKGDTEDVREEGKGMTEGEGKREGEKREPDPVVQKVEDMPSFEEWKRQMLDKQQAEKESKQQLEAQISAPGGTAQNKPKSRVNYARASCGAKVIAANSEATNPGFILTENRDQYMINPCNVKKWFVVELCEPIQIENLELGNLELFSSQPESFVVSSSGRYPTKEWKEWKELGTLHAREERTVQSFPVSDQLFTKYLQLEMKSHYGSEHYCPLTVLRVFGTTVLDDDNDEFAYAPVDGHAAEESAPSSKEDKPSNLFTTAADTVLSLVKTVLSPDKEQQNSTDDHQLDNVVKLDMATKNASKIKENQLNDIIPCVHHPRAAAVRIHSHTSSSTMFYGCNCCLAQAGENVCYFDMCAYFNVSNFTWPVCCAQNIHRPSQRTKTAVHNATGSLTVDKNMSQDVSIDAVASAPKAGEKETVAAIEEREKETKSDNVVSEVAPAVTPSESVVTLHSDTTSKSMSDVTVSVRTLSLSEVTHIHTASIARAVITASVTIESSVSPSMSTTGEQVAELTDAVNVSSDISSVTLESSMGVVTHGDMAVTPTVTLSDNPTITTQTVTMSSSQEQTSTDSASSATVTDDTKITPMLSSSVTKPTSPSQTHTDDMTRGQVVPDRQDKPVVQDSPEPTSNYTAKVKSINTGKDKATTDFNQTVKTPQPDTPSNASVKAKKDIYAELPSDTPSGRDAAPLPPTEAGGEEVPVNRLAKKEMTYMRLKNRIKTLEINLNLSSSYLEQLSQRYKLYMDNMYHYLNQTINKLANTTESAEARDLKQQEDIARLQKQVNNLSATVTVLLTTNDQLHKQVIERHLFLMLVEAVVFVCVIIWFVTRQHLTTRAHVCTTTEQMSPPSKGTPSHMKHRRYKSVDLTPSRQKLHLAPSSQDDLRLHKTKCDSALTIISHDIPLFITSNSASKSTQEQTRPGHKKKKKKGAGCQKQLWHKDSTQSPSHLPESETDSAHSSSSCTSSNPPQSNRTAAIVPVISRNGRMPSDEQRSLRHVTNIRACQSYVEPLDRVNDRFYSVLYNLKSKWTSPTGGNNMYSSIVRDTRLTNSKSVQLCKENGHI